MKKYFPYVIQNRIYIFSILLILTKPIIDFFWAGTLVKVYSAIVCVLSSYVFFINLMKPTAHIKKINVLFFASILMCIYSQVHTVDGTLAPIRYAVSLSGLYLLVQTLSNSIAQRINLLKIIALVIGTVLASVVLQLSGVLPYQVIDRLPLFLDIKTHWAEVGRLSGAFYHPLDLIRVLIWPFLATTFAIYLAKKHTKHLALWCGLYFLLQMVFLRTTHKATLVLTLLLTVALGLFYKKFSRTFAAVFVTLCAWVLSASLFSLETGFPFKTTFVPGHFLGLATPSSYNDGPNIVPKSIDRITTLNLDKGAKYILRAQGRHQFWKDHSAYIKSFSVSELLLGANSKRTMPQTMEPQPHNQLLDWIERFGILGTFLLASAFLLLFKQIPTTPLIQYAVGSVVIFYSIFTEIMIMPTFVWMAGLALYLVFLTNDKLNIK